MSNNEYTDCNHLVGPNIHIAVGNPSFILRDRGHEWLVEWHYYFGPSRLNKKTGDPLLNQPGERHRFWKVAAWWKDQGGVVVDGVGVWVEPPIIEKRFRQVNKSNLVADPDGEVVKRFYVGYEQWGPI